MDKYQKAVEDIDKMMKGDDSSGNIDKGTVDGIIFWLSAHLQSLVVHWNMMYVAGDHESAGNEHNYQLLMLMTNSVLLELRRLVDNDSRSLSLHTVRQYIENNKELFENESLLGFKPLFGDYDSRNPAVVHTIDHGKKTNDDYVMLTLLEKKWPNGDKMFNTMNKIYFHNSRPEDLDMEKILDPLNYDDIFNTCFYAITLWRYITSVVLNRGTALSGWKQWSGHTSSTRRMSEYSLRLFKQSDNMVEYLDNPVKGKSHFKYDFITGKKLDK